MGNQALSVEYVDTEKGWDIGLDHIKLNWDRGCSAWGVKVENNLTQRVKNCIRKLKSVMVDGGLWFSDRRVLFPEYSAKLFSADDRFWCTNINTESTTAVLATSSEPFVMNVRCIYTNNMFYVSDMLSDGMQPTVRSDEIETEYFAAPLRIRRRIRVASDGQAGE